MEIQQLEEKLIYICSPLKGNEERSMEENQRKALKWVAEAACIPGIIPIAPHTYFTLFLDDTVLSERKNGLDLGIGLLKKSDEVWVYGNTLSQGMIAEIMLASNMGKPIIAKHMERAVYPELMAYQQVFKESFNDLKWEEICKGMDAQADVSSYTRPSFSVSEMRNMRLSIEWDRAKGCVSRELEDEWDREQC